MEKRTVLAVVLSIVVIIGYSIIQGIFFPVTPPQSPVNPAVQPAVTDAPGGAPAVTGLTAPVVPEAPLAPETAPTRTSAFDAGPQVEQRVNIDTGRALVTLTNAGGDLVSYKLKEHLDRGNEFVEMIFSGDAESHALSVAFGDINAQPVASFFHVNRVSDLIVEFSRDFVLAAGAGETEQRQFRLTKRYEFKPDDYMFELTISLDGGLSVPAFNFSGFAYSLSTGPQIGPHFEKLDQRSDYRMYYAYTNGKLKTEKVNVNNNSDTIRPRPAWASVAGKYFALIALPFSSQYEMAFSTRSEPGLPAASRLYILRPALNASRTDDTYRFYLGPKNTASLAVYNTGNNGFTLRDMQLTEVAKGGGFMSIPPLEAALKWLLTLFHRFVQNWGVAIILLTILVKVILFPLTKKSSESTLRMQTLAPKIKEIQAKYKDSPQKMNQEMAEFYKKEGYNPLAGCLPMLLQLPIFFAMYNLFNSHFDLRGAMFIPGWIPDLSLPDTVWDFSPARLPILGWSALRLLPFIYVGSQLLYGKVTQTPDQQGNTQMKLMLYAMPIVFFFILYDMPSGLAVYWIMSNVLTLVQQMIINNYIKQKKAAMGSAEPVPTVIAPPKKRKRR
ncbi:membrane protein insertase YidC [Spirochaetia bacterium]|nr:membrane protein insertase YidC [Spirochaetia bacterium]